MEFRVPTRGLIGLRSLLLTATRGHSVMASRLLGYEPWMGRSAARETECWSPATPESPPVTRLRMRRSAPRRSIEPQTPVYEGMLVGLNSRPEDMAVNIVREKKQTNIRSSTSEIAVKLSPPLRLSLEQALDFIEGDELVEVTPVGYRLRKRCCRRTIGHARRGSRAAVMQGVERSGDVAQVRLTSGPRSRLGVVADAGDVVRWNTLVPDFLDGKSVSEMERPLERDVLGDDPTAPTRASP